MKRSIYSDGVVVDCVALNRTETTKAAEILRGRVDWTSRGLYVGGEVTVNLVNDTHVDVKQFAGFTPNGEFVDTDHDYYDLALDDESLNAVNLLCAVYTEVATQNQPHETRPETYPTRADSSRRVRIYSQANYNALPATDANLANDARDRCLVLAKITANGVGVALTASSIQGPASFFSILYSNPRTFSSISGVEIIGVSSGTPAGVGSLWYTFTGAAYQFKWSAPGSGGVYGAVVTPTADGIYNLVDALGEYIRVQIAMSVLPVVGTFPVIVTPTIINLYYQDIPRLTAEDNLHRHLLGTGTVTPQNPHGLSMDDISGPVTTLLEEHQDVQHCNGIWKGSTSTCLATGIDTLTPVRDHLSVAPPAGGDLYYVNGKKLTSIDVTDLVFPDPAAQGAYFYEVYASDEGTLEYVQKAAYPAPARTVTGTWIVDMSPDYPLGAYNLRLVKTGSVCVFTWANGPGAFIDLSIPGVLTAPQVIRLYAKDSVHWIDLYVNTATGLADDVLPIPSATYTDNVTVFASLDHGQNMQIASTSYWYDATSAKWFMGYPTISSPRYTIDKRPWGTLCVGNMSDLALEEIAYSPANELGRSGVLLRRNDYFGEFDLYDWGVDFTAKLRGGSYYCRGKRLTVGYEDLVFSPNCTSVVWSDHEGSVHIMNVTALWAGDLTRALHYILGSPVAVPPNTAAYHKTDFIDPPERGVALWYVETDGTTQTVVRDLSRGVNQVDDPWSVSSRRNSALSFVVSYYPTQAAFDSLWAAFEYAKYEMTLYSLGAGPSFITSARTANIEIHITGSVYVDYLITQPSNVNVSGTRGASLTLARVEVRNTVAAGTWVLSPGCQVHDLTIDNFSSGSVFRLANNVAIERCLYTGWTGAVTDTFIALYDGSGAGTAEKSGVRIRDNSVTTNVGMIGNVFPADNGYQDFSITGNRITVRAGSHSPAIHMTSCAAVDISKNVITVVDTDDSQAPGIQVGSLPPFLTRDVSIRDNVIATNNKGAQTTAPVGILLIDSAFCSISGNSIYPSGTESKVTTGIHLSGCANTSVHDNRLNLMGLGVQVGDYFYDIEIYRNKFIGCLHRGVRVQVLTYPVGNSVYGLRVEDNDMFLFAKGVDPGGLFDTDLIGVEIDLSTLSGGARSVSGVSVSRNVMGAFGSAIGGLRGVSVEINTTGTTTQESFKFDGNLMTGFMGAAHSNIGIYLFGTAAGTESVQHFSACENSITLSTSSVVNFVGGIASIKSLQDALVDHNTVHIMSAGGVNFLGVGIDIGFGGYLSRQISVSGNQVDVEAVSGMFVYADYAIVSGNRVNSYGEGIFVRHFLKSKISGNAVICFAHNENYYVAMGGGGGTHCISGAILMSDFSIEGNDCLLVGSGVSPALDVFAESACIKLLSSTRFVIEGNRVEVQTDTVDGGAGSVSKAYGIYFYASQSSPTDPVQASIRGNDVYNDYRHRSGISADSVTHGIYITKSGAWDPVTDKARIALQDNTVHCGIASSSGGFNTEVAVYPPLPVPAPPPLGAAAAHPYDIYVEFFDVLVGPLADNTQVTYCNNMLFYYPFGLGAYPNLYLAFHGVSTNGTNYSDGATRGIWW